MKVLRVCHNRVAKLVAHPGIPLHLSEDEDSTTKRVCCSMSLNGCLSSVDNLDYKERLYVYEADVDEFYQPTEKQVYDVYLTGELWLFKPTVFKLIGMLEITGYIGQDVSGRVNNQYAFSYKML